MWWASRISSGELRDAFLPQQTHLYPSLLKTASRKTWRTFFLFELTRFSSIWIWHFQNVHPNIHFNITSFNDRLWESSLNFFNFYLELFRRKVLKRKWRIALNVPIPVIVNFINTMQTVLVYNAIVPNKKGLCFFLYVQSWSSITWACFRISKSLHMTL